MSAAARLAAYFVAPSQDAGPPAARTLQPVPDLPARAVEPEDRLGVLPARRAGARPQPEVPAASGAAPRVCVLGGGRAGAALACALAARLVRPSRAGCGLVCVVAPELPPPRPLFPEPPARAARRLARSVGAGGAPVAVHGRVVAVGVAMAPSGVATTLAGAHAHAAGAPVVTFLRGPRDPELDVAIFAHDLVLVVLDDDAPPPLVQLAVAELRVAAPGVAVEVALLPARLGGAARRAAVTRAMEALR